MGRLTREQQREIAAIPPSQTPRLIFRKCRRSSTGARPRSVSSIVRRRGQSPCAWTPTWSNGSRVTGPVIKPKRTCFCDTPCTVPRQQSPRESGGGRSRFVCSKPGPVAPTLSPQMGRRVGECNGLTFLSTHEKIARVTTFGAVLRQLRNKTGLGIKGLAPELGVTYSYLSKLENNEVGPSEKWSTESLDTSDMTAIDYCSPLGKSRKTFSRFSVITRMKRFDTRSRERFGTHK